MKMKKTSCSLAIGLLFFGCICVAQSPQPPHVDTQASTPRAAGKVMKLTPMDYIEIKQLVYRYAYALDHCADNGDSYANLYVPDGEFGSTPEWDVPPQKLIKGHDALARLGGGTGPGGACKDPKTMRNYGATHLTVDIVITPVAGGAIGKSMPLLIGADGDPTKIVRQGGKQDFFVKTKEGWRFKSEWHVQAAPAQ